MEDLVKQLSEVLKNHKELALSDEEIRFIVLIMTGYALSPPDVRAAVVPEFKAAARKSMDLMGKIKKDKGQPN